MDLPAGCAFVGITHRQFNSTPVAASVYRPGQGASGSKLRRIANATSRIRVAESIRLS